jgi:hypothetical protein
MQATMRDGGLGARDVVDVVMRMGMPRSLATMVITYMWYSPRSSDPYSPSVIEIVKTLQSGLARLGYATRRDGFVGKPTVAALSEISGPGWKTKSWIEIYADVLHLLEAGARPGGLAGMAGMGDLFSDLFKKETWFPSSTPSPSSSQDFTISGGVCKPSNATALAAFKDLQRQINRLHKLWEFKLIAVDGRPGPHTTRSLNNIYSAQGVSTHYPDCSGYAAKAESEAKVIKTIADFAGAPAQVPDPSSVTSPPSVATADGKVSHPAISTFNIDQYIGQATRFASSPIGLAMVAGGVFLFLKRRKPKSKRRTSRRRR